MHSSSKKTSTDALHHFRRGALRLSMALCLLAPAAALSPARASAQLEDYVPFEDEPPATQGEGLREGSPSNSEEAPAGPWLALGLDYMTSGLGLVGMRLDGGWPLDVDLPAGTLSIIAPIVFATDNGAGLHIHDVNISPGVRWSFPVFERWGRIELFGDVGVGVHVNRVKDEWFDIEETTARGSLRVAAGMTFTFPFGLLAVCQPLGVVGAMGNDGWGAYEFAFLVGYQFE